MPRSETLIRIDGPNGAAYSPCEVYRYALWRYWHSKPAGNVIGFIGLNPSTATESQNDPTVTRCINFAKAWGFRGLIMLNAFGLRATNPRVMLAAPDPVGPGNDEALAYYRSKCQTIVACWGNDGAHRGRSREIPHVIGRRIDCLGINASGEPKHPLYLKSSTELQHFWSPDSSDLQTEPTA